MYSARIGEKESKFPKEYGLPLHTYCWQLTEQKIDPLINNPLRVFLRVLGRIWDGKGTLDNEAMRFACANPMYAPTIEKPINRCKPPGKAKDVPTAGNSAGNSPSRIKDSWGPFLPLEIRFMILDLLRHEDVGEMLSDTQWQIPDSYWRLRLHRGILFDIHKLDREIGLDWQLLCLKSEAMVKTTRVLRNRRRIIDILKDTAKQLWDELNNDERRELRELTQDRNNRLGGGSGAAKTKKEKEDSPVPLADWPGQEETRM